jgi:hypothetical protein
MFFEFKDEVNYMDRNTFVFHVFKTVKKLGAQVVPIPNKLKQIITKWSNINKADTLLVDTNGNPMTPSKLTNFII